ncbi:SOS response-associated peptidase, partial [Mesorhizobium sp. M7A.F.Ca.US.014.04.1.1]
MCGRVFVKSTIPDMVRRFEFAHPGDVERLGNGFPVWNGAPSREPAPTSQKGNRPCSW